MLVKMADLARKGECIMRIATVLVLMIISWVGLGYLFSDNINTHRTLAQVQQRVDQAAKDNKVIQDQLNKAISERNALQQGINQLTQQNTELQGQVKQLQGEKQDMKKQNSYLQSQLDEIKKLNLLVGILANILHQSLKLAILVPILPVSLVASFAVYRYNRRHGGRRPGQVNKSMRIMSINITEEEMQQIVKMRRGKK
jgi:septal ring factor EnvC (AmiA/AmiB activator)